MEQENLGTTRPRSTKTSEKRGYTPGDREKTSIDSQANYVKEQIAEMQTIMHHAHGE